MKFKDLLLFLEQEEPLPPEDDNDDINNPPLPEMPDDEDEPDGEVEPEQPEEPERPEKPKKLSPTQQVKAKWREENPALTDFQIDDAIGFFRMRKDALRPYIPFEQDPRYNNIPEVVSMVQRFPEMEPILSKNDQMKDLRKYPWEVMEFYMEIVRANNDLVDEENLVPGTKLPYEEQLDLAKEKWNEPQNQIVNDGGVIVYKIDCKNSSIAYGSIQRILNIKRREQGNSQGNIYWCTTVPLNDKGRSNLWTNYRPSNAFYYLWDQNRDETDKYYSVSIQAQQRDPQSYTMVDLYNHTTTGLRWDQIVEIYPQLRNKQQFFPWFDITSKERSDFSIDQISMVPGQRFYFGTQPESVQHAYVDSGRHVRNIQAFLTMRPKTRKLYVDKTTKENNDLQTRFTCDDNRKPFGILDILRLQKKPEDLYKYLDRKILKTNLDIPDGINAIKKLIIGDNWDRWLSDDEKHYTLIRIRENQRHRSIKKGIGAPYGVINTEDASIVKDTQYTPQLPRVYVAPYLDENGKLKFDKQFILQKYLNKLGDGNIDQGDGFYMFYPKQAIAKPKSGGVPANYLKGKYFELDEGDEYIREKTATGELKRI